MGQTGHEGNPALHAKATQEAALSQPSGLVRPGASAAQAGLPLGPQYSAPPAREQHRWCLHVHMHGKGSRKVWVVIECPKRGLMGYMRNRKPALTLLRLSIAQPRVQGKRSTDLT